ncbi:SDR family NAD(P)-dependent oxidoreductase [candidate division KSB1 bacterium]|nr:MAG: SDR family NAD(P)-dependent oxidoreductase [candidate division KSB1 bacterium]MCE7942187.1 SDR family NAD(P)-dependent oxidoreductase [Chlorobi bacterium CHB1]MDL1875664.1 SDR family NAD(P)-dependent oxidoreductase [Cytophagia bacterium CHB2]MBC6948726.1 SDR family NAD(P)-dependent oxidoreductase [candidate division KSB1 bacterium]NUM73217.1 SDR family NAD(P)-dependent oxidoreductase [candidate division KSB1 bacterium]
MSQRLASYWSGKSVLITGASSGLGAAVTEALAPYNIKFGLLSRRAAPMEELAAKLAHTGSTFWIRACDVREREQVVAAVNAFHQNAGRLDAVWVNSGVSLDTSFRRWTWENADALLNTNLHGAIYTTIASLQIMAPQKSGTIIGIGSAASMRGLPYRSLYSLSKISLAYFLESLAVELPDIQFTMIHPGFVDTPINRGNPRRFWLLSPPQAARLMITAVAKRKHLYIYPWRMSLLYRLVRMAPVALYVNAARKLMHLSKPAR